MPEQIVKVSTGYTYAWRGEPRIKIGDVVVLPPNWLFNHETEATVTALNSDYKGNLASIRRIARTKSEEIARKRAEKKLTKKHKHDVIWTYWDTDDGRSSSATVEVMFRCGCQFQSIHDVALILRQQLGWWVHTSSGHGGFTRYRVDDPIRSSYCYVQRSTLGEDPRSAKAYVDGFDHDQPHRKKARVERLERIAKEEVKREREALIKKWTKTTACRNGVGFHDWLTQQEEQAATQAKLDAQAIANASSYEVSRGRGKVFTKLVNHYHSQPRVRFDWRDVDYSHCTIEDTDFSKHLDKIMEHPEIRAMAVISGPIRAVNMPRFKEIMTENGWWITKH